MTIVIIKANGSPHSTFVGIRKRHHGQGEQVISSVPFGWPMRKRLFFRAKECGWESRAQVASSSTWHCVG